jgi:hypothetical protein
MFKLFYGVLSDDELVWYNYCEWWDWMDDRRNGYTIQRCLNSMRQATVETKFYAVAPNICKFSRWTCFMSPFQHLEFFGGSYIFGEFSCPWAKVLIKIMKISNRKVRLKLCSKYILRHKRPPFFCILIINPHGSDRDRSCDPMDTVQYAQLNYCWKRIARGHVQRKVPNFLNNNIGPTPKKTNNIQQNWREINHIN